jgi:alanine dehydrogenase
VKTPSPVLLLDREAVASLLSLEECITAVESAFAAHAEGRALEPALLHVDADAGEFHIKVGGLRGNRAYFAAKVNGGFFQNRAKLGLPNIVGLILLSDASNGCPLAIIESGLVTRLRTGAATAIAAKYLARPNSDTATICGAGVQAAIQLRSLLQVLPLRRVFIWSRSNADSFAAQMAQELSIEVTSVQDLSTATLRSDVIVTCTPSKSWFLGKEHVSPGTFIAAVGADSPDKQEIEPALLASSSVFCDLAEQCSHVGELHHAISGDLMSKWQIAGELGGVITGRLSHRVNHDEIIVFDSTGTALQDVAAAAAVYERAIAQGVGASFAFWGA